MLRAVVVALLIANAAFFAWSRGWLDSVAGVRAIGDREPERLARQVRPEIIRIVPPAAPVVVVQAACLEAGPFAPNEIAAAEIGLRAAVPSAAAASWASVRGEQPGAWIVYMGRYPSRELLTRKGEELQRRNVEFEEVHSPAALDPGLALGRFDDRRRAEQALEQFTQQGIRSAKVVEMTPPTASYRLRIDGADAALAAQLAEARPEGLLGKAFAACAKVASVN